MNRENIQTLINWLEAGAPEVVFSMYEGLTSVEALNFTEGSVHQIVLSDSEKQKINSGHCGSVCCIAGAAALLTGVSIPAYEDYYWSDIQSKALEYFGLPPTNIPMLPVFDPVEAPENCSPQTAAKALQIWADQPDFKIDFNPWRHFK